MGRLLLVCAAVAGCSPEPGSSPSAPKTTVPNGYRVLRGAPASYLQLGDYQGQVVLLDFWAPWSAPSRDGLTGLERLHLEFEQQPFAVIGMTVMEDASPKTIAELETLPCTYPLVLADERARREYGGVRAIPTRVLLGRNGNVLRSYPGWISAARLRTDVERALQGEPLPPLAP